MLKEGIAVALTCVCLVGASACHRPEGVRGSSATDSDTAKSVHPSDLAETYPALVREDWTRRAIHANRPPLALPRRASDSA
jgi:hypothetical protein